MYFTAKCGEIWKAVRRGDQLGPLTVSSQTPEHLCPSAPESAVLDRGVFVYEARALINKSKVKIETLQYSKSGCMKLECQAGNISEF